MRHALIHRKAELLDHFIDVYKQARKLRNVPHKGAGTVIPLPRPVRPEKGIRWWGERQWTSLRSLVLDYICARPQRFVNAQFEIPYDGFRGGSCPDFVVID